MDPLILGSEAVRAGRLTEHQLRARYRMVFRNVYLANDVAMTAELKARAGWLFAGPNAVLAGVSAAAVHGAKWLDPDAPAVIVRSDRHCPKGLTAHSYVLAPQDICVRRGMCVTTAARTAFDLARLLPTARAVPIVDALMNATRLKPTDIVPLIEANPGARGVCRAESALELVDGGAESPQETRLRLALVAGGLPAPETQIEFYDEYGEAFIRVDMGWRQWKVAVEYDGVQHWADSRQRAWDIERIAILEAMGWVVIRVSAAMLRDPNKLVVRVRATLRARGCLA
ncbi:hypothetical protein BOO86_20075 [Mycobacterium sp. CBMA 234]|uniref:endonuclease domain-containing protein n=1 Tax=Mycolicibacterium sp. CBMA 234 TaxID=1918495 RepID=UPI0012DFDDE4|nr:DUF559 domain-containing protein [Mycolicibacterium sp. CBMA 234]MUL66782.1 hypothetical protein [Mycolicibacterium sp. CBMA 234]